jgi:hypothetical protein
MFSGIKKVEQLLQAESHAGQLIIILEVWHCHGKFILIIIILIYFQVEKFFRKCHALQF